MYCKNCGCEMSEESKFCTKCGTSKMGYAVNTTSVESASAFFCVGTALFMVISAFLNIFKISVYSEFGMSFSAVEFSKTMKKLLSMLETYGGDLEEGNAVVTFCRVLSWGYNLLFLLAVIVIMNCLLNISKANGKLGVKFYKDIKSAITFMIIGNGLIFALLKLANFALKSGMEEELGAKIVDFSVFGGEPMFYISMILGFAGLALATGGINKCKDDIELGTVEKYISQIKKEK